MSPSFSPHILHLNSSLVLISSLSCLLNSNGYGKLEEPPFHAGDWSPIIPNIGLFSPQNLPDKLAHCIEHSFEQQLSIHRLFCDCLTVNSNPQTGHCLDTLEYTGLFSPTYLPTNALFLQSKEQYFAVLDLY